MNRLVRAMALRELRTNGAQHVAGITVAAIAALLGALLIEAEAVLQRQSSGGGFFVHPYVPLLLGVLGIVFVLIATFVAVIVTANTFAIVMAGRAKRTALLRLLGASATTLRRSVALEGATVGLVGALIGTVVGVLATIAAVEVLTATHVFLPLSIQYLQWQLVIPVVVGTVATTVSAWIGTRGIVAISPVAALGAVQEPSLDSVRADLGAHRRLIAVVGIVGVLMLIGGVAVGAVSPWGLLLAVPGGALSFVAFVAGSTTVLPALLRLTGRLLPSSAPTRIAAANAVRYPARAARSTIGLTIGITLVTMFSVAGQSYSDVAAGINATLPPQAQIDVSPFLSLVVGVIGLLTGFSLAIAAVGLVNSLRLSVLQRTSEIGLLRALGFSRRQVHRMIVAESIQLTAVGTACGVVLGTLYGWAGALTAISSDHHIGHYFWFSFPWYLLVGIVVVSVGLAMAASLVPARHAMRVPPTVAAAL